MDKAGELDDIDWRIIKTLRQEPRLQNRTLAKTIGVSVPTIYARLRDLSDARVCEIRAQRDYRSMGFSHQVFIDISVHGRPVSAVARDLANIDRVVAVNEFIEEPRLLAVVLVHDDTDLGEFCDTRLGSIEGITRSALHLEIAVYKYGLEFGEIGVDRHMPPAIALDRRQLDDSDERILESLRVHPRLSNRQIGDRLGISETNMRQRLGRLQSKGVVKFALLCAPTPLGLGVWGNLRIAAPPARLPALINHIAASPDCASLHRTAGQWNLHTWGLFTSETHFSDYLDAVSAAASGELDVHARRIRRVEKHNNDYVRILGS